MPAERPTSPWGRRPTIGSSDTVTLPGAVTVKFAALLVAALWPLQSSTASNCAPASPVAAMKP